MKPDADNSPIPDALLLIAPGCPHCPRVLDALVGLVKQGTLGVVEVINIGVHPERATELGARSAPWTRIGPFVLEGARSADELARWAERARTREGMGAYFRELLQAGQMPRARDLVREEPGRLRALLGVVTDPEAPMQVRLGAGALFEDWAGTDALRTLVPELIELTQAADHRIRADACHYLGLTASPRAIGPLRARLEDDHPEVREIAADSLAALSSTTDG